MRDLRWVAQDAAGRSIKEQAFEGSWARGRWVETPFQQLDLRQVISFGFEGAGLRVGFQTVDGIIGIQGRALECRFVLPSGRLFPLTGRSDVLYRVLEWKEGASLLGLAGRAVRNGTSGPLRLESRQILEAYGLGWEAKGSDEDLGAFTARLTIRIPADDAKPLEGTVEFRCERGLTGSFEYFLAGKLVHRAPSILRPGVLYRVKLGRIWGV